LETDTDPTAPGTLAADVVVLVVVALVLVALELLVDVDALVLVVPLLGVNTAVTATWPLCGVTVQSLPSVAEQPDQCAKV
jgi:hypothetical protein